MVRSGSHPTLGRVMRTVPAGSHPALDLLVPAGSCSALSRVILMIRMGSRPALVEVALTRPCTADRVVVLKTVAGSYPEDREVVLGTLVSGSCPAARAVVLVTLIAGSCLWGRVGMTMARICPRGRRGMVLAGSHSGGDGEVPTGDKSSGPESSEGKFSPLPTILLPVGVPPFPSLG